MYAELAAAIIACADCEDAVAAGELPEQVLAALVAVARAIDGPEGTVAAEQAAHDADDGSG